ncbi:Uncharacterised protein [Chlamydia trachomatis]|nr:Uncharacterised protein [Chlamydia trachomatis]CRH47755.1 Uncharacterised protein [Chlamydia trachomatis]
MWWLFLKEMSSFAVKIPPVLSDPKATSFRKSVNSIEDSEKTPAPKPLILMCLK